MGVGDLSGVGNNLQEFIPVKSDEAAAKAGKVIETATGTSNQDTAITSSEDSGSRVTTTHERTSRTQLRDLRQGVEDRFFNERAKDTRHVVKIQRPPVSNQTHLTQSISDIIKDLQRKYPLPRANDLINRLTPGTQKEVQQVARQALADPDLVNPKMFFDTLSKLVPLAIALINGGAGKTAASPPQDITAMLLQMMKEVAPHVNKLLASDNLPEDLKQLLQQLSDQLGPIAKGNARPKEQQPQIEPNQMREPGTVPNRGVLQTVEQLMPRLQNGNLEHLNEGKILVTNLAMIQMMSGAVSLSGKEQTEFLRNLVANQVLFSTELTTKGMLGRNTQEFANKISEMVLALIGKISESVHQPLLKESNSGSLLKLFSSILFGGALLGKMIADRGDGKAWTLDEAYAGQLVLQSAKELRIFDLVPFSLFAFFPPLKEERNGLSEEQKAASKLLMKLIRLLMDLVFMITSIYSGGHKIGNGGIDYLLEKNSPSLLSTLDQLSFALTEVHKLFRIDIKSPLAFLRDARQSLLKKDHPLFWASIFAFFTEENDLNVFLEEVEELEPFYQSIHRLFSPSL